MEDKFLDDWRRTGSTASTPRELRRLSSLAKGVNQSYHPTLCVENEFADLGRLLNAPLSYGYLQMPSINFPLFHAICTVVSFIIKGIEGFVRRTCAKD